MLVPALILQICVGLIFESREFNNKWYTDVKAWKIEFEIKNENKKNIELTENDEDPF